MYIKSFQNHVYNDPPSHTHTHTYIDTHTHTYTWTEIYKKMTVIWIIIMKE